MDGPAAARARVSDGYRRQPDRQLYAGIRRRAGGDGQWRAGPQGAGLARNPEQRPERRGRGDRGLRPGAKVMLKSPQKKLVILGASRFAGQPKNPSSRARAFTAGGGMIR